MLRTGFVRLRCGDWVRVAIKRGCAVELMRFCRTKHGPFVIAAPDIRGAPVGYAQYEKRPRMGSFLLKWSCYIVIPGYSPPYVGGVMCVAVVCGGDVVYSRGVVWRMLRTGFVRLRCGDWVRVTIKRGCAVELMRFCRTKHGPFVIAAPDIRGAPVGYGQYKKRPRMGSFFHIKTKAPRL